MLTTKPDAGVAIYLATFRTPHQMIDTHVFLTERAMFRISRVSQSTAPWTIVDVVQRLYVGFPGSTYVFGRCFGVSAYLAQSCNVGREKVTHDDGGD